MGDASNHSEDNMAISVFDKREESRDQREHFLHESRRWQLVLTS